MNINEQKLLEELSALEHEQWMFWAQRMLREENISPERAARWKKSFVPYEQLDHSVQELDRNYAQKALDIFKRYLTENK